MIDCDKAKGQLYEYLDGELTPRKIWEIFGHLTECRRCFSLFEFEYLLKQILRKWGSKYQVSRRFQNKIQMVLSGE
ncbi:MAG: zf-HC2 domain-containing protein [Candidatus Omnitrophica bacterium]|nr:zf-HC2 domain-containing protein [Candidatus Omnitrophota bacterium]